MVLKKLKLALGLDLLSSTLPHDIISYEMASQFISHSLLFFYISIFSAHCLSFTALKVYQRAEDEQHPVKHFHEVCSRYQRDSCGFPVPV